MHKHNCEDIFGPWDHKIYFFTSHLGGIHGATFSEEACIGFDVNLEEDVLICSVSTTLIFYAIIKFLSGPLLISETYLSRPHGGT